MMPPAELRLLEQDVWLAVELTRENRMREGYLVLDCGLAAVQATVGEWSEVLADCYREVMVAYTEAHGFDPFGEPAIPV